MRSSILRFIVSVVVIGVVLACAGVCYGVGDINEINIYRNLGLGEYECAIDFSGVDIERIELTMPWGQTYDTNNLLPGGWAGEDVNVCQGSVQDSFCFEAFTEGGKLHFDFWNSFDSATRWATLDSTVATVTVTYTDQTTWTGSLAFNNAVIPTQMPVLTNPVDDQNDVYLRLTVEWDQWLTPAAGSFIVLHLKESISDEEVLGQDVAAGATEWHVIDTLKSNTDYSAELYFTNGSNCSVVNGVDVCYFGSTFTAIEFTSGDPYVMLWRGFYHDRYFYDITVRVDDVNRLQVITPWGDTFDSNDFLPAGWSGQEFDDEVVFDGNQSVFWIDVQNNNGANEFHFAWWFDYEPYWTALDNTNIQVTITRRQNPVWNESLSASGIVIPSETPTFVYPQDLQNSIWRKPTFKWQNWSSPSPGTWNAMEFFIIESGIDIAEAKDLTADANNWTSPIFLEANTDYEASMLFVSEITPGYFDGLKVYYTGFRESTVNFTTGFSTATGADFNTDGQVNLTDLAILVSFWLGSESSVDIAPEGGDGVINLLDFSELASK